MTEQATERNICGKGPEVIHGETMYCTSDPGHAGPHMYNIVGSERTITLDATPGAVRVVHETVGTVKDDTAAILCPDCQQKLSHVSVWISYRDTILHDGQIIVGQTDAEVPDDSEDDWFECAEGLGCGRRFSIEEVCELVGINEEEGWEAVDFT